MNCKPVLIKTVLPALLLTVLIMTFSGCTPVETPQPAPPVSTPEVQETPADVPDQPPVNSAPETPVDTSPDSTTPDNAETPGAATGHTANPPTLPPAITTPVSRYISQETAKKIAVDHVGSGSKIRSFEEELDDSPPKFEIELEHGNYQYDLEIHAITGAIIDFEREEKEHSNPNDSEDDE